MANPAASKPNRSIVDITEIILSQHAEQRRLFALLDEFEPHDSDSLGPVWDQLATALELHAKAEEELFYPALLELGTGAGGEDSATEETTDAIKDHNEIRDGVRVAAGQMVGSDEWWAAVTKTREANSDHMAEEEREDLADFRRHADLNTRHQLAVTFVVYEARHSSGVVAEDKDPEAWVQEHNRSS